MLLTILAWGVNYAIVKTALQQIPELAFNSLRLALASLLFLGVLAFWRDPRPDASSEAGSRLSGGTRAPRRRLLYPSARRVSPRDWAAMAVLAVIGQFVYQLCFMGGIARTSVANSALIQGCSPVVITLLAAAVGQERVSKRHWFGVALSLSGVYLLVGLGATVSRVSFLGDLLMLAGVCCWATFVVGSRPLLDRYSPVAVSGYTMAMGAALYVPLGLRDLRRLDWTAVPPGAWAALVYSAVFSLFLAYLVWYTSIKRIGNVRTAMYSNLIPVVALLTAVVFLGNRLDASELVGASVILVGVWITRPQDLAPALPAEE